jgi:hypothetical protein
VKVRWAWLSYLLVLFGLSFVFLVAVMIKSSYSQADILKSWALAVIYAFSEMHRGKLSQVEMRGKIWQEAQKINVRLVRRSNGWQLGSN